METNPRRHTPIKSAARLSEGNALARAAKARLSVVANNAAGPEARIENRCRVRSLDRRARRATLEDCAVLLGRPLKNPSRDVGAVVPVSALPRLTTPHWAFARGSDPTMRAIVASRHATHRQDHRKKRTQGVRHLCGLAHPRMQIGRETRRIPKLQHIPSIRRNAHVSPLAHARRLDVQRPRQLSHTEAINQDGIGVQLRRRRVDISFSHA